MPLRVEASVDTCCDLYRIQRTCDLIHELTVLQFILYVLQLLQLGYCNQGIFCGMSMLEYIVSPRQSFNVENNDYMATFLTPPPFLIHLPE